MTLAETLGVRLREQLKQRGWSQRKFAEKLGVTQGTISYLLAGKRRSHALDLYERLAAVEGMPLSQLIRELEDARDGMTPRPTHTPREALAASLNASHEALYDVARQVNHEAGFPWTDPRTGITYPPDDDSKT